MNKTRNHHACDFDRVVHPLTHSVLITTDVLGSIYIILGIIYHLPTHLLSSQWHHGIF